MLKEIICGNAAPGSYLEGLTALDASFNQLGIPPSAPMLCCSLWLVLCDWRVDDAGS